VNNLPILAAPTLLRMVRFEVMDLLLEAHADLAPGLWMGAIQNGRKATRAMVKT
jgi:hypothetical protein